MVCFIMWSLVGKTAWVLCAALGTQVPGADAPAPAVEAEEIPLHGPAPTDRSAPALYQAYCARCHGVTGAGDGPVSEQLSGGVRSLVGGMRHYSGSGATGVTSTDVLHVLERGVPDSAMASFAGLFSPKEAQALARHVVRISGHEANDRAEDVGPTLEASADDVMEGAVLYARAGCASCHGVDGTGGPMPFVERTNADGTPARFTRLDWPVTWRGGNSPRQIAQRLAVGIPGTPMPAYRPSLRERELWQLALYVQTMARVETLEQLAARAVDAPPPADRVAWGERQLEMLNCTFCHRLDARVPAQEPTVLDLGPLGAFTAGPLVPAGTPADAAAITEVLTRALRDGEGTDGRRLHPLAMPWPQLGAVTDVQLDAMGQALAQRPRSTAPVTPPRHAGWLAQALGKVSAAARLVNLEMRLLTQKPSPMPSGPSPLWVSATALAITVAVVMFLMLLAVGGAKRTRRKRTFVAMMPVPVGALVALLLLWPAYDYRPLSNIKATLGAELPAPLTSADPTTLRVAQWGRQLVSAAGCGTCHTAQNPFRLGAARPLAGGVRVRGQGVGRVHGGNLTPHEDGLGEWSDVEVRRAFRAGVGEDGHIFHPLAMPLGATTAFSDAELQAVITYLRALPPLSGSHPAVSEDDDSPGLAVGLFEWD